MKTIVRIWSEIGHCPITKRIGPFCDELAKLEIDCESPGEAFEKTLEIMHETKHAARGHFEIHEYWNQNTRSRFVSFHDQREKWGRLD